MRLAGVLGALAVALGAFGAHALRARVSPELLDIWKTGCLYHLLHAIVLLALGLAAERVRALRLVRTLFCAGIIIFAGSLYLLTLTGARWWGAVTPLGGVAFITGWLVLAATATRDAV